MPDDRSTTRPQGGRRSDDRHDAIRRNKDDSDRRDHRRRYDRSRSLERKRDRSLRDRHHHHHHHHHSHHGDHNDNRSRSRSSGSDRYGRSRRHRRRRSSSSSSRSRRRRSANDKGSDRHTATPADHSPRLAVVAPATREERASTVAGRGLTSNSTTTTFTKGRTVLEEDDSYAQWLRGAAVCSSSATDIRASGGERPSLSGRSGDAVTTRGTSTTRWEDVCEERRFSITTDLTRIGTTYTNATHTSKSSSINKSDTNLGTSQPDDDGDEDELSRAFRAHFDTGKAHPKPPWYLCGQTEDNREHPYYMYWLDRVEMPSLQVQLARSRERISLRQSQQQQNQQQQPLPASNTPRADEAGK